MSQNFTGIEGMEFLNSSCSNAGSIGIAQLMLTQLISTITKSYCDLNPAYPVDQSLKIFAGEEHFDFIVVGAGSSGSAIANRLSEVPHWKILLIEAGPDPPIESSIPALFATMIGSKYDWKFATESSEKACRSMENKQCLWPKGKMLGGSSSMNCMLYMRGLAKDYDNWERLGNSGWAYKDLLKYFQKLEKVGTQFSSNEFHGYDGYVNIEELFPPSLQNFSQLEKRFKDAGEELGLSYHQDFAANMKSGVISVWGTVKNGIRDSAAKSYLEPIKSRQNLIVMKESLVTKLLIDDNKLVYGVRVHKGGILKDVICSKEVILSAGAVNSPKLMMLSGLGPKEHLIEFGIPLVVDLKVGYNLQDHIMLVNNFIKMNTVESFLEEEQIFYNYLTKGSELAHIQSSMIYMDTLNTKEDYPDMQYHIFAQMPFSKYNLLASIGLNSDVARWFAKIGHLPDLVVIWPTLLRPSSRGRIFLSSANFADPPKIVSGYLEHDNDIKTFIRGLKFLEKLMQTEALKNASLLAAPAEECKEFEFQSDKYYECYIRNFGTSVYHVAGSCKMGPKSDPNAVVDPRLEVYQVKGLRVADTSIMPIIVSGNTNIPAIMIGEKAADLIKEKWLKSKSEL